MMFSLKSFLIGTVALGATVFLVACGDSSASNAPVKSVANQEAALIQEQDRVLAPLVEATEAKQQALDDTASVDVAQLGAMPASCKKYLEQVQACVKKSKNGALIAQLNAQQAHLMKSPLATYYNRTVFSNACQKGLENFLRNAPSMGC